MKNSTKLVIFIVFCTMMINVTLFDKSDFLSNMSIFKLSVASADDGESGGGATCYRVKNWYECPAGSHSLFRITECEAYTLVPPLVCDHCQVTSCD